MGFDGVLTSAEGIIVADNFNVNSMQTHKLAAVSGVGIGNLLGKSGRECAAEIRQCMAEHKQSLQKSADDDWDKIQEVWKQKEAQGKWYYKQDRATWEKFEGQTWKMILETWLEQFDQYPTATFSGDW